MNGVVVRIPEVEDYIAYMAAHPAWINADRRALMEKVVRPTLMREDVTFDRETYDKCLRFCERNYYPLFPFQKFLYALVFLYDSLDRPVFSKFVILMGRGNGKDGFIVPLANFLQTPLYGVRNYHVELVANSEDQIKDTFKVAYDMLYDNPKFNGLFADFLAVIEQCLEVVGGSILLPLFGHNTKILKHRDIIDLGFHYSHLHNTVEPARRRLVCRLP